MRVEILSLAFRMISSSSIGVPSTPNFVKAMRINLQNMKCIIEIPCGMTLPVERTPSRLSVLSSQCWELSSSRSALYIGIKRWHSPKCVIVSLTRLHILQFGYCAFGLCGCSSYSSHRMEVSSPRLPSFYATWLFRVQSSYCGCQSGP